jgi:hypothetical protein
MSYDCVMKSLDQSYISFFDRIGYSDMILIDVEAPRHSRISK